MSKLTRYIEAHDDVVNFIEKSLHLDEYVVHVQSRATSIYKSSLDNKSNYHLDRIIVSYDVEVASHSQLDRVIHYHIEMQEGRYKITGRSIHINPPC